MSLSLIGLSPANCSSSFFFFFPLGKRIVVVARLLPEG